MSLWDHLCSILRARVVSMEDVSSKARPFPKPYELLCMLPVSPFRSLLRGASCKAEIRYLTVPAPCPFNVDS